MTAVAEPGSFLAWREAFQAAEDACPWPGPRPLKESDGVRLLVGRELDHSKLILGMKRREDPLVDTKVGMAHMRAFDGPAEGQSQAPEPLGGHGSSSHSQIVP